MNSLTDLRRDEALYNFRHFRRYILRADMQRTIGRYGIAPGDVAPDFALPLSGGQLISLRQMAGRPVLLHFGSYT
jgi:hypothetical protein